MNVYDFTVQDWEGKEVSLSKYKGKILLIMNTATECGFTPTYEELQELYDKYRTNDFYILDFPCNQFGGQAPGSMQNLHTYCAGRFGVTFPQFMRCDVKGENAIPLFKWLTENTDFKGFDLNHPIGKILDEMLSKEDPDYTKSNDIKWNFTKFLIDAEGNIVERFEPTVPVSDVKNAVVEQLLSIRHR